MVNQSFIVTFRFATPPILRGACTLDAVLGGEIGRDVADLDEAIKRTPLAVCDGIFQGSALLLTGDLGITQPVPVVQKAVAAFWTIDPATISRGKRKKDHPWMGNLLNTYDATVCEGGVWLGHGDMDAVNEVLSATLGIGKRRHAGLGMIAPDSLAIEPVDADPATWGLVSRPDDPDFATETVTPRRPLPLDLFRRLGGDPADFVVGIERVRQPYYAADNPPEPAVLP